MKDLAILSAHLKERQNAILEQWRERVRQDPSLKSGRSMPRSELNDHVPGMLSDYERELMEASGVQVAATDAVDEAAAHGLHRWQQGYDLSEVTCELGRLNECMVDELDRFAESNPAIKVSSLASARALWAAACTRGIADSASEYFRLRQIEAAGHVRDLERALEGIRELEQQRAELWMQAAHDLRGNLGVVSNVTAGLAAPKVAATLREDFLGLLQRNVRSLHHLLDDVTSLARLQAGQEERKLTQFDVGSLLHDLCEALAPLATEGGLYLRFPGPNPLQVQGDAVKIRRLAQNLILNAIKYTQKGGVVVDWGHCGSDDRARWSLSIEDTGPGFNAGPGAPMAGALMKATELTPTSDPGTILGDTQALADLKESTEPYSNGRRATQAAGEGIGLSIVKRLCELLDATIELESTAAAGTRFRILIPHRYTSAS